MLIYCWSSNVDGGPTLNEHCLNVLYFLGPADTSLLNLNNLPTCVLQDTSKDWQALQEADIAGYMWNTLISQTS